MRSGPAVLIETTSWGVGHDVIDLGTCPIGHWSLWQMTDGDYAQLARTLRE
jgi:hypothetical protein